MVCEAQGILQNTMNVGELIFKTIFMYFKSKVFFLVDFCFLRLQKTFFFFAVNI